MKNENTGGRVAVHMPRIGQGMRGFDWYSAERLVKKTLCSRGVVVFVYYFARRGGRPAIRPIDNTSDSEEEEENEEDSEDNDQGSEEEEESEENSEGNGEESEEDVVGSDSDEYRPPVKNEDQSAKQEEHAVQFDRPVKQEEDAVQFDRPVKQEEHDVQFDRPVKQEEHDVQFDRPVKQEEDAMQIDRPVKEEEQSLLAIRDFADALPNFFTGIKFFIQDQDTDRHTEKELVRRLIAYGADQVMDPSMASHVIVIAPEEKDRVVTAAGEVLIYIYTVFPV
jgi:hypothetical protein